MTIAKLDDTARVAVEGVCAETDKEEICAKAHSLDAYTSVDSGGPYTDVGAAREHPLAANDNAPERERIGGWMQTYTGRAVYPMDLRPEDICIEDIAHSLAHQCRYAGHCLRFYSVAEHSVHVARWLLEHYGPCLALEGLLHDAAEAYLVDVPRPVKPFLVGYKKAELRAMGAVAVRFDLDTPHVLDAVYHADARILHDERQQNMARSAVDWELSGSPLGVTLEFWSPERAKAEFLALFHELYGEE